MAAKVVIKIKDAFFLQKDTILLNLGRVIVSPDFFELRNTDGIGNLYPAIKNSGNIAESKLVFQNLLNSISSTTKLESLYSVIDAEASVNLMQMAWDRNKHLGENLLNFYFIEVNNNILQSVLQDIKKLSLLPNSGIQYVYLRGELVDHRPTIDNSLKEAHFDRIDGRFITVDEPIPNPNSEVKPKAKTLGEPELPKNLSKSSANPTSVETIRNLFSNYGFGTPPPILKDGFQLKVIDLEQGWNLGNTGISSLSLSSIWGTSSSSTLKIAHGTNTLNVLVGSPSNSPTKLGGLCKNATIRPASTYLGTIDYREASFVNITHPSKGLSVGDIILLEIEIYGIVGHTGTFPVETDPAYHAAILAGVEAQFIVIEAAGNGGLPLNSVTSSVTYLGNNYKNLSTNVLGTGAIMVGSIKRLSAGFSRLSTSNYGNRIDCYCMGENILTTANTSFNSTSLASAVIAALVANMQIKAINKSGLPLNINQIKNYLVNPISYPVSYAMPNNGSAFRALYP